MRDLNVEAFRAGASGRRQRLVGARGSSTGCPVAGAVLARHGGLIARDLSLLGRCRPAYALHVGDPCHATLAQIAEATFHGLLQHQKFLLQRFPSRASRQGPEQVFQHGAKAHVPPECCRCRERANLARRE